MKKLKIIWILTAFWLTILSSVNGLALRTLKWPIGGEFSRDNVQIEWEHSIFNIISLVNNYLWFIIGAVCFWFMVWNGYNLIMARGEEKEMKNATNSLIGCAVWLVVCILAHIIVNIAVKLFA